MAKNYRAGPGWLPGTVIERNGPLSYLIKVNGGQLWRRHIDQLREVDDTPAEHPSEQLQESLEDTTDWTIYRRATQVNESTSTASSNHNDTQPEVPDQPSVPVTQPRRYPLRKRTPNKKYL